MSVYVYVCVSVSECVDGWVGAHKCALTEDSISSLGTGVTDICRIPS